MTPFRIVLMCFIVIANTAVAYFASYRYLQSLQLNSYRTNRYFSWVKYSFKTHYRRLFALSLLSLAALVIVNTLFFVYPRIYDSGIGLVFYFIFMSVFVFNEILRRKNTPIVYTRRMKRLIAAFIVLSAALSFLFVWLATLNLGFLMYTKFFLITLTPLILPPFIGLVGAVTWPFEEINNKRYIRMAKTVLDGRKDLIKIAITGSYGKTSVKNILATLLGEKYSVLTTPASYNTPMGLCKVINRELKPEHQVFIAEMGAKNLGDIKYLCSFIKPDYGIITSVGTQHLETFRTVENIKKAKYELVENMNQEGLCVFNGNDAGASEFFSRCQIKKLRTGFYEDDESVYTSAKNIKIGNGGAEFDLCFAGKKPFTVSTALLGRHNIENILLAAALARYLGLSSEEIKQGIEKLEPVEHRLKLIRNQRGINIIDDSFNASVSGTQAALDVLAKFESNKIIITPGLIELGDIEKHENFKFGQNIAAVADFVILVGPIRTVPIKAGLMKGNFPEEKIIIAESRADAVAKLKNIMKPGDTVLFENDLPDNYSDR